MISGQAHDAPEANQILADRDPTLVQVRALQKLANRS